jgi:ABC-type nitrate/sulfonate/bicarbonate transport system substrate-binding protein
MILQHLSKLVGLLPQSRGALRKIQCLPAGLTVSIMFFLCAYAPVEAQEKIHVAISSFSASYISMFIAQKRGYYAEEGLAAEIVLMAGLTGTRALIGNSVEFGSASNPTAAVQGAKLKILMVFNDKPPGIFAAQPGFKTVSDLRGKRVGGSTVGSLDYGWMKELLPKFGLQLEKDVIFVPVGSTSTRLTALKAGTIDAAPLSPPASVLALDAGYPALFRFADHLEDIQASIVATDDRLARQSDVVHRFMRATVKGQRVYLANRQTGITAIMEFTRHKDRELMTRVYDDHMKTIARDGTISERLQGIVIERSKRLTGVTRDVRPEEIFDCSYLKRVNAELDQIRWVP